MPNVNVLSQRYATEEINAIFSEKGKIILERELWIAVLKAQQDLGLDVPSEAISAYNNAKDNIDLGLIKDIERRTRHDVKARIEAFNRAAGGYEFIHRGMTSRDVTDNVEQMQIKNASTIIFNKYIAILNEFVNKAQEYDSILLSARTHRQAAQPTLLGRRFAMWAEELYYALVNFENFIENYPLRGIKGPVGTQFDSLTLLGTKEKVHEMERRLAESLGFKILLDAPGQIYPRSLDHVLAFNLTLLSSACDDFAKTMRLMSGHELVSEGFKAGQVGSSAMPHKMNTRSSERICGFCNLLKMYADGASRLSGDQWEEGDVSCSVVRRVIIPDMFYVSDGLCETTLTVLNELEVFPKVISTELEKYLPFMASTALLTEAVKRGLGREKAHEIIRKYTIAEALKMRETGRLTNNLATTLGHDSEFPLNKDEITTIFADRLRFSGNAKEQINYILKKTRRFLTKYSTAASYEPKPIL